MLFVEAIGVGLIFPILPELFLDKNHGFVAGHGYLGISFWYGIAIAIFPLMSFVGMPVFGKLSDIYGRKNLLVIAMIGALTAYLLSAVSVALGILSLFLFARSVMGLCSSVYIVAISAIGDITKTDSEKIFGFRWATFFIFFGLIVGPVIGSLSTGSVGRYGLVPPFLIAALLSFSNILLVLFILKETNNNINVAGRKAVNLIKLLMGSLFSIFEYRFKNIKYLLMSYMLFQLGIGLYMQSISLFLVIHYHYTSSTLYLFYIAMSVAVGLSAIMIQPVVQKYFKLNKIAVYIMPTLFSMFVILFLLKWLDGYSHAGSAIWLWCVSAIAYALFDLLATSFTSIFSSLAEKDRQGELMGVAGQVRVFSWFVSGLSVGFLVLAHWSLLLVFSDIFVLCSFVAYVYFLKKTTIKLSKVI